MARTEVAVVTEWHLRTQQRRRRTMERMDAAIVAAAALAALRRLHRSLVARGGKAGLITARAKMEAPAAGTRRSVREPRGTHALLFHRILEPLGEAGTRAHPVKL